uniref:Otopetrin 1 n=1 Tax=Callorhinchus milii TaxID=7868 RepID=A0A4W3JE50_CALMI
CVYRSGSDASRNASAAQANLQICERLQQKESRAKTSVNRVRSCQMSAATLSAQYGVNVFVLGLVLTLAMLFHRAGVAQEHVLAYLSTAMAMQLAWMLCYSLMKHRQKGVVSSKDAHAGARWLRGGLILFGILSLVLDVFKIGYYIGYSRCLTAAKGVFPVVHAVHTISQVYFLWFHAKDVIQTFQAFERFGMIHAVFTNLLLWVNGVVSESKHQLIDHKRRLTALGFANITVDDTGPNCSCNTNACAIFYNSSHYMYPFNIEFHVFASAMFYVMWKNVGRTLEEHRALKVTFRTYSVMAGPVLGTSVLAATIGILIVYSSQVGHSTEQRVSAVAMFYLYGITVLCLMSAAAAAGLVIYRVDKRSLDYCKNPTRKLDGNLLVSTACASWFMSWCSIVAAVCGETQPPHTWLNLSFSVLVIIEKYLQNLFIIESLYRKHGETDGEVGMIQGIFTVSSSNNLPLTCSYCGILNKAFETSDNQSSCSTPQYSASSSPPPSPPPPHSSLRKSEKLSKERQFTKNVAAFLFLCNISVREIYYYLIMTIVDLHTAFGARPQFDSGLEEKVYGFEMWILVVNIAMPFAIFYRMHSSAALFEIFCLS